MDSQLFNLPLPSRFVVIRKVFVLLRQAPILPSFIVIIAIVMAVFGPGIAPHNPSRSSLAVWGKPPAVLHGGNSEYILGTDRLGRDVLSRVIVGTRVSLSVAAMTILFGGIIGTALGLLAGYVGGWVDALIMRIVDLMMAFPSILIALILAVTLGPSFWNVVIVLALVLWARYARLIRGDVIAIRNREFVDLARIAGCSSIRIVLAHILPNVINSVIVLSTLQVGWVVIMEACLTFMGAGVPPPTPTWGGMLSEGRNYIETLWWVSIFPGIAIMLLVLSFNTFGNWLREVLDPRLSPL